MAFRDQVRRFEGETVKVETVDGTFIGKLAEVKSSTLILRDRDSRRTIIRNSKIIAVTEFDDHHHH